MTSHGVQTAMPVTTRKRTGHASGLRHDRDRPCQAALRNYGRIFL
ncbi:hypothetical protein RAJCM14343_0655 [Rhodococcus aetherivorans]|uniref:Uncharacterized protein n=1 Tax=Rhodococcus aetherivorans TaxID=191292 RepID=A0ABQ0YFU8_9NOCA|nr:hypothetical protein RAJCM14343_0655 [Rhodococcus aetherivorans]CCW14295.1 hypothetical protein EBESD8_48630 [Rhodococcus aetherivorans]